MLYLSELNSVNFININDLNIDHQITIYVLSKLINDYKSYYEKIL